MVFTLQDQSDAVQRHGALPTGATFVRASLTATLWSKRKHSRTGTRVQEADTIGVQALDGAVHSVLEKAQRIGDGQIKVVYGLRSSTLALKMASKLPCRFGENEFWSTHVGVCPFLPKYYGCVMVVSVDHDTTWRSYDLPENLRANYLYLCDKVLDTVQDMWKRELLQLCSPGSWRSHVKTWKDIIELLLIGLKKHDALFWDYKGDNIGWLIAG